MKKYLYKHIRLFQDHGKWHADYNDGAKWIPLHRHCSRTKAIAYTLAKREVDDMNERS